MYPAPNSVARLFRFKWSSGLAKIWRSDEIIGFYESETNGPRTSLDNGQRLRATIITSLFSYIFPSENGYGNLIPDLIHSCLHISCWINLYFSQGVALSIAFKYPGIVLACPCLALDTLIFQNHVIFRSA